LGSIISIFGVFVFFLVVFDLIKPFGVFFHNYKSFVYVPYSKISFFSNNQDVYIFPKYRFLNNVTNYSLIGRQSVVFYSLFRSTKFNLFKILKVFNHFWFYCFLLDIFPNFFFEKYVKVYFNSVLFFKTFNSNIPYNFYFFSKIVAQDSFFVFIYVMLLNKLLLYKKFFK